MYRSFIVLISALLLVSTAYAEPNEKNKPGHDHRGPPDVALEACSNSVQGDPCSFEGRRGEAMEGICEASDEQPLACRPEGGPPKRQLERQ